MIQEALAEIVERPFFKRVVPFPGKKYGLHPYSLVDHKVDETPYLLWAAAECRKQVEIVFGHLGSLYSILTNERLPNNFDEVQATIGLVLKLEQIMAVSKCFNGG